jgi:argonaute-like protein implicated in RNA metabolism and viral defense
MCRQKGKILSTLKQEDINRNVDKNDTVLLLEIRECVIILCCSLVAVIWSQHKEILVRDSIIKKAYKDYVTVADNFY